MKNLIKLILMLTFVSLNLTFSTVVFAGFFEDFVGDTFVDNDTNGVKARAEARALMGITSSNAGQKRAEALAYARCENITKEELESDRTLGEFMGQCANGINDGGGCRLNFESTCINGKSVPMVELFSSNTNLFSEMIIQAGFEPVITSGYTSSDFSDPNLMYNKVKLSDGNTATLCSKIPGFNSSTADGNLHADIGTVVESTPAIFKPQSDMGSMSVHTKIRVIAGPDGKLTYDYELELREPYSLTPLDRDGDTKPYKVSHQNLYGALTVMIYENMVRCKKNRHTFVSKTNPQNINPQSGEAVVSLYDTGNAMSPLLPTPIKKEIADLQSKYYVDPDTASLNLNPSKAALLSILGISQTDPALTEAPSQEIATIEKSSNNTPSSNAAKQPGGSDIVANSANNTSTGIEKLDLTGNCDTVQRKGSQYANEIKRNANASGPSLCPSSKNAKLLGEIAVKVAEACQNIPTWRSLRDVGLKQIQDAEKAIAGTCAK